MNIDSLLTKLEKVQRTKKNSWLARCPAHDDHSPSLSIRDLEDGRILVHCFAGCNVHEIVSSVGMKLADLFQSGDIQDGKGRPERRPFPATDILRCIAFEALVVAMAAIALLKGPLPGADYKRLMLAASRIQDALRAGGISDEK